MLDLHEGVAQLFHDAQLFGEAWAVVSGDGIHVIAPSRKREALINRLVAELASGARPKLKRKGAPPKRLLEAARRAGVTLEREPK